MGRFEGFEDALATAAAEDSGWAWTGTRALTAMKDMLSPRYSAIMSMSAYPEAKGGVAPPVRSQGPPRAANAKASLQIAVAAEEPTQVQISHHHTVLLFDCGPHVSAVILRQFLQWEHMLRLSRRDKSRVAAS